MPKGYKGFQKDYKTNTGRKHTEETRKKMSTIRKGRKFSEEHKSKIADSQMGEKNSFYGKTHTEEKKRKWSKERKGNKNNWRGGTTEDNGYILVRKPQHFSARNNGYILRSRLVMEKLLGRELLPNEIVHHKNGITGDDRPENLRLFKSRKEHTSFHHKQRKHLGIQ